jgi:catechol 2,3-dioxygenase-like lactoylglutathione lyase family enzyme
VLPSFDSAAPTFLVPDVGKTARWYVEHLGFAFAAFPKNEPFVYASMWRDRTEIMLLRQEGFVKTEVSRPGGVWDAYIRMNGLLEFYETVRENTPIRSELTKRPYGDSEFEVRDPKGYILVFGEIIDGSANKVKDEPQKVMESK